MAVDIYLPDPEREIGPGRELTNEERPQILQEAQELAMLPSASTAWLVET